MREYKTGWSRYPQMLEKDSTIYIIYSSFVLSMIPPMYYIFIFPNTNGTNCISWLVIFIYWLAIYIITGHFIWYWTEIKLEDALMSWSIIILIDSAFMLFYFMF